MIVIVTTCDCDNVFQLGNLVQLHSGHGHRHDGQCDEETRNAESISKVSASLKFLLPRIMLSTEC